MWVEDLKHFAKNIIIMLHLVQHEEEICMVTFRQLEANHKNSKICAPQKFGAIQLQVPYFLE